MDGKTFKETSFKQIALKRRYIYFSNDGKIVRWEHNTPGRPVAAAAHSHQSKYNAESLDKDGRFNLFVGRLFCLEPS